MIQADGGTNVDRDKDAPTDDDDAIIAECQDRMRISLAADGSNRVDGLDDLAFLKGGENQWDPSALMQRRLDHRPCLTINKMPAILHQVTNSQRKNVPCIKVHPANEYTDDEVAEVVQGAIRHIEYKSKADVCYDTAVNSAAAIGFGYFRLVTQYVDEDSFDQEIAFKRIRNPFTVYMDPSIVEVDGSDQQWCILSVKMPRTEFVLEYPKADPLDANTIRGLGDNTSDWITVDQVRVAEYYRIHRVKAKVVQLSDGTSGYADEVDMSAGATVVKEREGYKRTVQWFKLTATEVLERADIPCKWIPVFPVFGDEIDVDGVVSRFGLIRNAKDPARMYNFWMTCATEEVGLRPKAPYIGAEGQFEGHEDKWDQANVRSFARLEYKPKSLGGTLVPPPARQPMADVPVGVLAMAAQASDDVKGTMNLFDAALGARSNETSGVAIKARDRQGETANFHYSDNLNITLRHVGECILNMWPEVYDSERTLRIMGVDGSVKAVEINKPQQQMEPQPNGMQQAVDRVLNDMTIGEFAVTIAVGPSYDTLRQDAVDSMLLTAQSWPKLMDVAGDKVVRSFDWPMADEIADRIEKTIDPALRKGEKGAPEEDENMVDTPKGPIPKDQIAAILEDMDKQMADMHAQLKEAEWGIKKAKLDADSRERVAEINAVSKNDVAELQGWVQMLVKTMTPPPILTGKALTTGNSVDNAQQPVPAAPPAQDQMLQGGQAPEQAE